jgi:hypothetical protein
MRSALTHGQTEGICIAQFEQGEIGPDLFRAAWKAWYRSDGIDHIALLPISKTTS